jgi:acetyl-CoA C-acetyltransferase
MESNPVVILGARRTPLGCFGGELSGVSSTALGSNAIRAVCQIAEGAIPEIAEVYMGCVLPAGLGQAPARQAALAAGISPSTCCTTVNKMCGSGMKAVMLAFDGLHARHEGLVIAGGMESMSRAPYLLQRPQGGTRFGHQIMIDHMLLDGLEDAYEPGRHMGTYAEDAASDYQLSREAQDEFALDTLLNARAAIREGAFAAEISIVDIKEKNGGRQVNTDEQPGRSIPAKITTLKPAFRPGGTVTAANSSSISDGAAALLLARRQYAYALGLEERASIVACAGHAHQPSAFTTAPVQAIRNVLHMADWTIGSVDLFEINEAFAVVPMIAIKELSIPRDTVNVHGGACALGHPIGASGARIAVTLLHALERRGLKRGIAAICLGGGEALAIAIERRIQS